MVRAIGVFVLCLLAGRAVSGDYVETNQTVPCKPNGSVYLNCDNHLMINGCVQTDGWNDYDGDVGRAKAGCLSYKPGTNERCDPRFITWELYYDPNRSYMMDNRPTFTIYCMESCPLSLDSCRKSTCTSPFEASFDQVNCRCGIDRTKIQKSSEGTGCTDPKDDCIGCCGGPNAGSSGGNDLFSRGAKLFVDKGACECKLDQAKGIDPSQTPTAPAPTPCEAQDGDPIGVNSGYLTDSRVDVSVPGPVVIGITPYYHSQSEFLGPLGWGWSSLLSVRLFHWDDGSWSLRDQWGRREDFLPDGSEKSASFHRGGLAIASDSVQFRMGPDQTLVFLRATGALVAVRDDAGRGVLLQYDASPTVGSMAVAGSAVRKYPIRGVSPTAIPEGFRTVLTMDLRVSKIVDAGNSARWATFAYDTAGMVDSVATSTGANTKYAYDARGNLVRVRFADGTLRRYAWSQDGEHRLLAFDGQPIRSGLAADSSLLIRNSWDVSGRVVSQSYRGGEYTIAREPYARSVEEASGVRTLRYVRKSSVVRSEPDGLGGTRVTTRVYTDSVVNTQTLPSGNAEWAARTERIEQTIGGIATVRWIGYDRWNNIQWLVRPDGARQDLVRDASNRVVRLVETPPVGRGPVRISEYGFDAASRLVLQRDSVVGRSASTTRTWNRDALGRVREESVSGAGGTIVEVSRTWDALGRLATEFRPSEGLRTFRYLNTSSSLADSVTFADGTGERYTRDATGRIIKVRNHLGQYRHTWYDAAGRDTLACGFDSLCVRSRYDGPDLVGREEGIRLAANGTKSTALRVERFAVDNYGRRVKHELKSGSRWILVRKSVLDSWGNEVEAWDNPDSTNTDSTRWRLIERNVYDGLSRRLERRTFPNGRSSDSLVERFAYDAIGNIVSSTDARKQTTTRTVDPWGNVLSEIDPLGRITTRTYDHGNRVLTETDAAGRITSHLYDVAGNETRRIGVSKDTSHWVYQGGLLRKERSPEGSWTTYHYDSRGRLARMVRKVGDSALAPDANDVVTGYAYDALGNRLRDTVAGVVQNRFEYDAGGRVVRDTNATGLVTESVYDNLGRHWKARLPTRDTVVATYGSTGGVVQRLRYKRPASIDTIMTARFDDAGRPVWQRVRGAGGTTTVYNGNDDVVQTTDSNGIVVRTTPDRMGRDSLVSIGTGPARRTVRDAAGRVIEQWDEAGKRLVLGYDVLDRLVSLADHEGNTTRFDWSDSSNGWSIRKTVYPNSKTEIHYWDREGRLRRTVDGRGHRIGYSYDSLGQLVRQAFRKPDGSVSLADFAFRYDAWGRLVKAVRTSTIWDSTEYDALGRPSRSLQSLGNSGLFVLGYSYNDTSRLRTLTLPDGSTTRQHWNFRGSIDSLWLGSRLISRSTYVAANEATRTYGNGVVGTFRNQSGRIGDIAWARSGQVLPNLQIGYDARGNCNLVRRRHMGTSSEAMGYSVDNQLTAWASGVADTFGTIADPTKVASWVLDSRGNWTSFDQSGVVEARTHDGANELTLAGSTNLVWDEAGNLTSEGTRSYRWGTRGLLDSVLNGASVVATYGYDALGRRISTTRSGALKSLSVYDGWQCVWQKVTGSGTDTTKAFVFGNYIDEPLAMVRNWGASTDTVWYQQGNNFNVEALTDRAGAIVERYEYTPYGKATVFTGKGADGKWFTADDVVSPNSARGNGLTFQGRELDPETGNYYFRARYYSAWMGRFVSRDPLRYGAGDLNILRFVKGQPTQKVDPLGLMQGYESNAQGIYDFFVSQGYVNSPLAQRMLWNWLAGGGPMSLSLADILSISPQFSLSSSDEFNSQISSRCRAARGSSAGSSFSVTGTTPSVTGLKATLGNFAIDYTVQVSCDCDGEWTAVGSGMARDIYDFDLSWFSNSRSVSGQFKVFLMNFLMGNDYPVSSVSFPIRESSADGCAEISGAVCGGLSKSKGSAN